MRKDNIAQKTRFSFFGYLMFFALVSVVATCAILVYRSISDLVGGNPVMTAIFTLLVLLLLAFVCTAIDAIRRKLTVERPVQNIVKATKSITIGDYSVRLKPVHAFGKYDEFDVIMDNINRMAEELAKTELLRTDFICNVSHEIKTPLAVIQNYAVGLQNEKLSPKLKREYTQTLLLAAQRLSDLVTNILKLNKLENQEIYPAKTKVELGEQLRESILAFEDKIACKQLQIECDIEDIAVMSDAGLLEIIWNNLLSNAIKFTKDGGKIKVNATDEPTFAVVTITDSGCGISKEVGARIFDKFFQGDTSHSAEGNGLGLTLVKRVIEILGGEISIQSKEKVGSTFTIKIKKEQ